ncbi:MAG: glycosyltransferase [Cyanobacteria bacterium P01_D01_bin.156]
MQVISNQSPEVADNSNTSKKLVKVAVCAATYKRPELLEKLLESLNNLTFTRIPTPVVEVIIVDNDSAGSAQSTVEDARASFQWPLKYFVETNQGVTYARNRCVTEVAKDTDFIAMLDDDEYATPQWLEELLISRKTYNAEIVAGPVLAVFREGQQVPNWMKSGEFHTYPRHETGQEMETAFTGNVMFSTQITNRLSPDESFFDHRFAQKGAEDAYLFSCLYKEGYKIVWANNAVLYEPVADQRLSLKWILKRGFWSWSTHSIIESELYPSIKVQGIRAIKGLGLILIGAVSVVPSIVLGKARLAWSLLRIYRGMGTLSGLLGRQGNWQ